MREKLLPEHEREAIAAELRELLALRDKFGRRIWTQASLGAACGGVSQQVIYLAQQPARVGPTVRDGVLKVLGLTMAELLQKHRRLAQTQGSQDAVTGGALASTRSQVSEGSSSDPFDAFRRVLLALQDDGFDLDEVRKTLAQVAFEVGADASGTSDRGTDVLQLYRRARAALEPKRKPQSNDRSKGGASSGVQPTRSKRRAS